MAAFEILVLLAIVGIVIVVAILMYLVEKKRREALAATARRLGLQFHPHGEEAILDRFGTLEAMNQGERRRTRNVLVGVYRGVEARIFDFIYETDHRDSKGRNKRTTHHVSVAIASVDARWPKLTIVPENFGHKLFDALGGDDIDFESDEFSRKFWVKSDDRKFAYDLLHARAMEHLMGATWGRWQLIGAALCTWRDQRRLQADQIQPVLDGLVAFLDLVPTFRRPTGLSIAPAAGPVPGPPPTVPA